jgi:glyoxylase-like metal-dependent hydrolase (beta-lactamase superfamily II)
VETVPDPSDLPRERRATVHVVQEGYIRNQDDGQHVGSTIGLVVDGVSVVVVDPGFTADRAGLLRSVRSLGVGPGDVTDLVFSHHHPDHTVNAALFPNARIHDHWAVYDGDVWHSRPADRYDVSPSVRLIATPGHTEEDISTVVATPDGVVVFTHAWWTKDGPEQDPYAPDQSVLRASRDRILSVATTVVPGHGPAFRPHLAT